MSMPLRQESWAPPEPSNAPAVTARRRRVAARRKRLRTLLGVALCIGTCGVAAAAGWNVYHQLNSVSTLSLITSAGAQGRVTLNAVTAERRLGFVTVTGSVVSRSSSPLHNVEAVVELLNARQETVGMESSLVAFDPVTAGEKVPFRVELVDSARVVAFRVRFRQLSGTALD